MGFPVVGSSSWTWCCGLSTSSVRQLEAAISFGPPAKANGWQSPGCLPNSSLPSLTWYALELPVRPTATVLPLMASEISDIMSHTPFFLIDFFQPALPVLRSTIWRSAQTALSVVPLLIPMTILPSVVVCEGAAHRSVGSFSVHFCFPSTTE